MDITQARRLSNNSHVVRALMQKGYNNQQMVIEYLMYQYNGIDTRSDEDIIYELSNARVEPDVHYTPPKIETTYQQQNVYDDTSIKNNVLPIIIIGIILAIYFLSPADEAMDAALFVGDIIETLAGIIGLSIGAINGVQIGRKLAQSAQYRGLHR